MGVDVLAALPVPPDLTMPQGWERFYTAACLVALMAMGANAVRLWRARRDSLPLLLMAGGALCVFLEPLVDKHRRPDPDRPVVEQGNEPRARAKRRQGTWTQLLDGDRANAPPSPAP